METNETLQGGNKHIVSILWFDKFFTVTTIGIFCSQASLSGSFPVIHFDGKLPYKIRQVHITSISFGAFHVSIDQGHIVLPLSDCQSVCPKLNISL